MRGALIFLLLLGACRDGQPVAAIQSACAVRLFDGARFTVCEAQGGAIEVVAAASDQAPARTFAELNRDEANVAFAMNAGMYDDDGRPIGLAIVDGREVHAVNRREGGGNFHLLPNGVFLVRKDGRADVIETSAFKPSGEIAFATQSGPMLVIGGKLHPKFEPDGQSRYIRNGVGVRDGKALFVISQDPVSFGKMARLFRDDLKTPNALYFDGSVSSLWDPVNGRQDAHTPIGPMVVVSRPR